MELVRYADRPDLRELRRAELNEFPEFMNHNAMGWKYWGRLYDEFPEFQLALLDGDRARRGGAFALSVPVDGDELPAGWDEAFERGMEAGGGNVLSLLAISVAVVAARRGLATTLIAAAVEAAAAAGLESVIAPVRPTLKERYPLIPIEEFMTWRRETARTSIHGSASHERVGGRIERAAPRSMLIEAPVADWEQWTQMTFPADGTYVVPGDARAARGAGRHRRARRAERLAPPRRLADPPFTELLPPFGRPATRNPARQRRIWVPWRFEIQAHRGNDPLTIRRLLAAAPSSLELDVGLADGRLVVAHDVDHGDASGLGIRARARAGGRHAARRRGEVLPAD